MQRPVSIVDKPPAFPYICIGCGIGDKDKRKFYVDLGFDIADPFNPVYEGVVYLCNECMEGTLTEYYKKSNTYNREVLQVGGTYKFLEEANGRTDESPTSETDFSATAETGTDDSESVGDELETSGDSEQTEHSSDVPSESPSSEYLLELRLFPSGSSSS